MKQKFLILIMALFLSPLLTSKADAALTQFQYANWANESSSAYVNLAMKPKALYSKALGWNEIQATFGNSYYWTLHNATKTMNEQYYCHADNQWIVDLVSDGEWNLEPWRMTVNNKMSILIEYKCNPPRASLGCVIAPDGNSLVCPMSLSEEDFE